MTASLLAMASPVTRQQALEAATRTLACQGVVLNIGTRQASKAPAAQASLTPYYIFNGDNGFVIAAGDDRMPAVLGYSDSATLDCDHMPQALEDLLRQYATEAASLAASVTTTAISGGSGEPISPLLKTRWGQGLPYNLMSPATDNGTLAATGSVATAMAQVMYFHKWPLVMESDIPGYVSTSLNLAMPPLSFEDFPWWNDISTHYTGHETDSLHLFAVARLMQFCGHAVNTDYGTTSRAKTADIVTALSEYFKYKPTLRYLQRPYYTASEWTKIIYDELSMNRPVIYRAQRYGDDGHAFVVDGVDANGLFHINWGWHGACNGYFALTALNPMERESVSDPAGNSLACAPAMVVGIEPNRNLVYPTNPGKLSFYDLTVKNTRFTRADASAAFEGVTITGRFGNGSAYADTYDFGFAIFDKGNKILQVISSNTLSTLYPNFGVTRDWDVTIGASVPAGTYAVRPVSRVHGTVIWNECIGSRSNYAEFTISDQSLVITPKANSGNANFKVINVAYKGNMQVHRDVETTALVTNSGTSYLSYIYLIVDGQCSSATQCEIKPGSSGDVVMHFTPHEAGRHSVVLALDPEGTRTIYSGQVNITEATTATLTASRITIKNLLPIGLIAEGTFAVTATIANRGSTPYSDDIVARLYRDAGNGENTLYATAVKHVEIAAGSSTDVDFSFNNLTGNERFGLTAYYFTGGVLATAGSTPFYMIAGDYDRCDVNRDYVVDVTDLNLVVNAVLGRRGIIGPTGHEDVNGNGHVDVMDINLVINRMLKK